MHEVELANRVLKALRKISAGQKSRLAEVNLKVGEINEPSSIHFWLKKLGEDEFRSTKFKITKIPLTIKCAECGHTGPANLIDSHLPDPRLGMECPNCGGHALSITTGQELEIVDVKFEEVRK